MSKWGELADFLMDNTPFNASFDAVNTMELLVTIGQILLVILIFNLIIFVHELGHFWAARWRGLHVDKFQIWFGKAIWSKEINGVQWGLGTIPFGGFVALPQLAPMETIEGSAERDEPLPKVKPLDKIIVAFAGPLFSFLLAAICALGVWKAGKPVVEQSPTTVGFVLPGSAAEKAGMQVGDKILEIAGTEVTCFAGNFESGIKETITLSEGEKIEIKVKREGESEPVLLHCGFKLPETGFFERKGTRKVGIAPEEMAVVGAVMANSPAEAAGLKEGDVIVKINGDKVFSPSAMYFLAQEGKPLDLVVKRGEEELAMVLTPRKPKAPHDQEFMAGIQFQPDPSILRRTVEYPSPIEILESSGKMMFTTLAKLISPQSSINVGHLSSPLGIGRSYFDMLNSPEGWRWVIWFTVVFNVNLAILNMMPFPVLDGGHITLGFIEMLRGKGMEGSAAKGLEIVQTMFALALISLMLFVLTKDIADLPVFGGKKNIPIEFAPVAN